MRTGVLSAACLLLVLTAGAVGADDKKVAAQVRLVLEKNAQGVTEKDIGLVMSTLHSQSPEYNNTRKYIKYLFEDYDVKVRLVSVRFMGSDEDCAIARAKYELTKEKSSSFRDQSVEYLQVFRKEADQWKLWASLLIEVKYSE